MRTSKAYRLLMILTVVATLVGCNRKTVFAQFRHVPIEGWERSDSIGFEFACQKSMGGGTEVYEETVGLRISGAYPFKSLYLIVEQETFPARIVQVDTLVCPLVNEHGVFHGRGINYYQYDFPLRTVTLTPGDSLSVRIRHNMKREILPGVIDVGLTVRH